MPEKIVEERREVAGTERCFAHRFGGGGTGCGCGSGREEGPAIRHIRSIPRFHAKTQRSKGRKDKQGLLGNPEQNPISFV